MRVLVTGANGFLGQHVVREVLERWAGASILALGDPPDHDLRNPEVIARCAEAEPDMVFHLAAVHFVPWCREHPDETLDVNANVTRTLLDATAPLTFVLASSAAVYGLDPVTPAHHYIETDALQPVDVYGISKVLAEQALELRAQPHVRYIAARLFNLVGPNDPVPHLIPTILARTGRRVPLDLEALRWARDFTHVEDAARALVDLAAVGPPGFTPVNVCTGRGTTGWDLVKKFDLDPVDNPLARREGGGHLVGGNDRLYGIAGRAPRGDALDRLQAEDNRGS